MPATLTETQLRAKIAPFVNAKRNRLPQTEVIDILHHGCIRAVDASVRGIGPEGVKVFFYSSCETISWTNIDEVVVRSVDHNGDTLTSQTYCIEQRRAAA